MRVVFSIAFIAFVLSYPVFGVEFGVRKSAEPANRSAAARAVGQMADDARRAELERANQILLAASRNAAIEFEEGTERPRPNQEGKFKNLANAVIKAFEKVSAVNIVVEGHTESSGSAVHDKGLSQRRAEVVCASLVKSTGKRCIGIGYGSTQPLVTPEDTPAKQAKNRRIVVQVAEDN